MAKPHPLKKMDTRKALKMRLAGASYATIAKAQGVDKSTVCKSIKPLIDNIPGAEHLVEYQSRQADVMDAMAAGIVGSVTTEDYANATLQQKCTSIGILTDKSRLIRGQSTGNLAILVSSAVKDTPVSMTPLEVDDNI